VQYGFLIDHTRCIGCHACTVACKAENSVPVGSFRTWVKYTEKGRFPDVRRHFAVLRCNHCTKAPCVTICPVNALEKRPDGIVDIDRDACIGCKACMQACPYDAIYLNDDLGAVEKCHFCAHRVEKGLEPACAVVCPEEAIISGDLDDPASKISRMLAESETLVRRPEQNTGPNVHYKGVEPSMLDPGSAERPSTYIWSDRPAHKSEPWPISLPVLEDTRTVLDAGHRVQWGWQVAAYLVTKGIAAGAAILAPFVGVLGLAGFGADYAPEVIALVFTLATAGLLIEDLARPHRFYRLLTRPNWRSWLVKGGIVLGAFGAVLAGVVGLRLLGLGGAADGLRWAAAALGLGVAGYTAFLFAQCEGRDLWQGTLLLPHLLVQAVLCGAVVLLPFATYRLEAGGPHVWLVWITIAAALGHLAFALAERYGRHGTANAKQAAAFLGTVRLRRLKPFRDGLVIGVGLTIFVAVLFPAAAFVPALVGLYLYESAYIRAGQLPPLS
jgi:Fe-S-cluster-containing dehydrogenase component/formate-dependent nitrite reductase membrane component NrfD